MPKRLRLHELTGRANELASVLLNSTAFKRYGDCCGVEELAEQYKTTSGRIWPMRTLEQGGLVTIEGEGYAPSRV